MFSSINSTMMGIFNKTGLLPIQHGSLCYLRQFFDDRLISRDLWPARTPDLTPLDYYLFPHLKNTAFKEPVHTIDDLKIRIREEYQRATLRHWCVFENMKRRFTMCVEI
jgi:hypothetical protein